MRNAAPDCVAAWHRGDGLARAGDLKNLTLWATGDRVTKDGEPEINALLVLMQGEAVALRREVSRPCII